MYELPSMPGLKKVVIDENVIKNGKQPLYIYENDAGNPAVVEN